METVDDKPIFENETEDNEGWYSTLSIYEDGRVKIEQEKDDEDDNTISHQLTHILNDEEMADLCAALLELFNDNPAINDAITYLKQEWDLF